MVTRAPRDGALLGALVGLALDAQVHDGVLADGAFLATLHGHISLLQLLVKIFVG